MDIDNPGNQPEEPTRIRIRDIQQLWMEYQEIFETAVRHYQTYKNSLGFWQRFFGRYPSRVKKMYNSLQKIHKEAVIYYETLTKGENPDDFLIHRVDLVLYRSLKRKLREKEIVARVLNLALGYGLEQDRQSD